MVCNGKVMGEMKINHIYQITDKGVNWYDKKVICNEWKLLKHSVNERIIYHLGPILILKLLHLFLDLSLCSSRSFFYFKF